MEESHPIPIDYTAAHLSGVLRKFLKDIDPDNANQIVFIICDVQKNVMKIVFQWMHHHRNDPLQRAKKCTTQLNMLTFHRSKKRTKLSSWDEEFFKNNHNKICEIMKAAKALKIPGLYHMAAQSIADLLTMPATAIRREFLIPPPKKQLVRDPLRNFAHTLQRFRFLSSAARYSTR